MKQQAYSYSITELNRLRDRAYVDAELLRQEALQDFWRGADLLASTASTGIRRSASRFANTLQRRMARIAANRAGRPSEVEHA